LQSPLPFLLYIEKIIGEAMEEVQGGTTVGGQMITDLRFADDQAMLAGTIGGIIYLFIHQFISFTTAYNKIIIEYGT